MKIILQGDNINFTDENTWISVDDVMNVTSRIGSSMDQFYTQYVNTFLDKHGSNHAQDYQVKLSMTE
jgi:hypothetical protein